MYSRRRFIQLTATASAGALLACENAMKATHRDVLPPPGTRFPRSMSTASRREIDVALDVLAGDLPRDLMGHVFTIGSVPTSDDGPQVIGDGMVYRLSLDGASMRIKTGLVRTDCFLLDEATQNDEELGFRDRTFIRSSSAYGIRNFANTAFVPIQDDRLLVSYDAGRPWEIDPATLEVITPVGLLDCWTPFLPPITPNLNFFPFSMTSAHPAYDADEQRTYLVNFAAPVEGLNTSPFTRVLWWDGDSEPQACEVIDQNGDPAVIAMACHQINVTQNYIVLLDTAFRLEAETFFGGDLVTRPSHPYTVMWIVPKAGLVPGGQVVAQRAVVATEGAHAVTLRDDTDGVIDIFIAHQNSFDPSEWIAPSDVVAQTGDSVDLDYVGLPVQPADRSIVGRYKIAAETGEVLESLRFQDSESWAFVLYSQDPRSPADSFGQFYWGTFGFDPELLTKRFLDAYAGHPERQVALQNLPREQLPSQIVRFDADAFEIADRFVMPLGYIGLSPTFAPREHGESEDGYIVLFVVNDKGDEIWIFESKDLAAGPICRLGHRDLDFGFTLHTTWLPELRASSDPPYVVNRSQDYEERLRALPMTAQNKAREVLGL
jgi:carotenoid cleavage dioxygenase-like enzyme